MILLAWRAARLIRSCSRCAGVVDYALSTLEVLVASDAGLQSLADEGGAAALESYLAGVEQTPLTEDAVWRAQQLLAALGAI